MPVHEGHHTWGPPFSVDLLADLHAGVLPDDESARLWPLVRQDPAALEVIAALDAVSARLRSTGSDHALGTPVPPEVVSRIDGELRRARPASAAASVTALDEARSRRTTRSWIAVAIASTAAAGAIAFALDGTERGPADSAVVATPASSSSQAVDDLGSDLDDGEVLALMGRTTTPAVTGPLSDPDTRTACLMSNGIDSGRTVLATREVRFRNRDAVLLLVAGPRAPALTALVVGTGCDGTHTDLLVRSEIG